MDNRPRAHSVFQARPHIALVSPLCRLDHLHAYLAKSAPHIHFSPENLPLPDTFTVVDKENKG